jgi:hypothetical protein
MFSDKRNFFLKVRNLSARSGKYTIEDTVIKDLAKSWLDGGFSVVCRHLLNAHSGEGIEIINPGEELPKAPLYTKYFKKSKEFRVHVFYEKYSGKVQTFSARKVLPVGSEVTEKAFQIRTSTYGWRYTSKEPAPDAVIEAVQNLVHDCSPHLDGMYFCGGFDVILRANNSFRILECNATPGMSETTAEWYAARFEELIDTTLTVRNAVKGSTRLKPKSNPSAPITLASLVSPGVWPGHSSEQLVQYSEVPQTPWSALT